MYLSLSYVQIQPYNCLYSVIAFLENWTIDEILMEVLQDGKKKVQKYGESFYEYKNSFTMHFLRISLIFLDNGKLLDILALSMCVALSIINFPSLYTHPPETYTNIHHFLHLAHNEMILFNHCSSIEASSNNL